MKQRLILIMAFFACAMTMMADRGWAVVVTEKGDFLDYDRVVDL